MLVNSLIVVANEVFVSMVVDNQMLENKLTELTSLVRQLAIDQLQNVMVANQPRLCGICCTPDHCFVSIVYA